MRAGEDQQGDTRGQTTGEWKGEGRGREKQRRDNTRGWESLPANLIMGGALSFLQNIGKKICLRIFAGRIKLCQGAEINP